MKTWMFRVYRRRIVIGSARELRISFTLGGHGYDMRFAICASCGELYLWDAADPRTVGWTLRRIALGSTCVACGADLAESALPHPQFVRMDDGTIVSADVPSTLLPTDDIVMLEVPMLRPRL
jgi:hypothetical protein